jgi:hypothetical protein
VSVHGIAVQQQSPPSTTSEAASVFHRMSALASADNNNSGSTTELVTVAVGDTFLFSALSTQPNSSPAGTLTHSDSFAPSFIGSLTPPRAWLQILEHSGGGSSGTTGSGTMDDITCALGLTPLLSDSCCITHQLPYYHNYLSTGQEDKAAHLLVEGTKSRHMYVSSAATYLRLICIPALRMVSA